MSRGGTRERAEIGLSRSPHRLALRNTAGSSTRSQARGTGVPRVEADSRRPCSAFVEARDDVTSHSSARIRHRRTIGGAVLSCAMSLTRCCGPGRLWTARAGRDACRASNRRGHEGTPAVLGVSIVACRSHETPHTLRAALRAGSIWYRAIRWAPVLRASTRRAILRAVRSCDAGGCPVVAINVLKNEISSAHRVNVKLVICRLRITHSRLFAGNYLLSASAM
jgi:hypothetical protein